MATSQVRQSPKSVSEIVMLSIVRSQMPSTILKALTLTLAGGMLAGCVPREELPYHLVHNPVYHKARNIFVDPVGKGFPALVQQRRRPMAPLPTNRVPYYNAPASTTPGAASTAPSGGVVGAPNEPPVAKPATLKPARQRATRLTPAAEAPVASQKTPTAPVASSAPMPRADVVEPAPFEVRASTQLRR